MRPVVFALGALALLASGAAADVVVLRKGDGAEIQLEGKILEEIPERPCRGCGGTGREICPVCRAASPAASARCLLCKGAGKTDCARCAGTGRLPGQLRLQIAGGAVVTVPLAEVAHVERRPIAPEKLLRPAEYYQFQRKKLADGDAQGRYELGVWCFNNGLAREARVELEEAVRLDPALKEPSRPFLEDLARRDERAASLLALAALALIDRGRRAEGAKALAKMLEEYGHTKLARSAGAQAALLKEHFPRLAALGLDFAGLARTDGPGALACPDCGGRGRLACADCKGSGGGACPDCKGSGEEPCPVCAGKGRLTCPRCIGKGIIRQNPAGMGLAITCEHCKGRGELVCDICAGRGKVQCRRCRRTGRIPGTCARCRGAKEIACPTCGGSGFQKVTKLAWGPPPDLGATPVVIEPAGERARVFQGGGGGSLVTVVPARALYGGLLTAAVARAAGEELVLVCVAVDNRKGKKLVRYDARERTLQLVTEEHAQVAPVDLAALLAKAGEEARPLAAAAGPLDVLPGAYACGLAAFPKGTAPEAVTAAYLKRGGDELWKLEPRIFGANTLKTLRESLR
jgi:DnaJ-class molecular chaperone